MKSYMTEQEKERQKSKQLSWYNSRYKISDYYPTVEIITISYHQVYRKRFWNKRGGKSSL